MIGSLIQTSRGGSMIGSHTNIKGSHRAVEKVDTRGDTEKKTRVVVISPHTLSLSLSLSLSRSLSLSLFLALSLSLSLSFSLDLDLSLSLSLSLSPVLRLSVPQQNPMEPLSTALSLFLSFSLFLSLSLSLLLWPPYCCVLPIVVAFWVELWDGHIDGTVT